MTIKIQVNNVYYFQLKSNQIKLDLFIKYIFYSTWIEGIVEKTIIYLMLEWRW